MTVPGTHRVPVRFYAPTHLQPGDHVAVGATLLQVSGASCDGLVSGIDVSSPVERVQQIPFDRLEPGAYIVPGPGRTAGLRSAFWETLDAATTAARNVTDPGQPWPTLPFTGASIDLTVGGGLALRHGAERGAGPLALAVPGLEVLLGYLPGPGSPGLYLGHGRARYRPWNYLPAKLDAAGGLDGGLTDAGRTLRDAARAGRNNLNALWTRALQAHLGLDPDHPSLATTAVAALAPAWTRPLHELQAVLTHLGMPRPETPTS